MTKILGVVAALTIGLSGAVMAQDANPVGEWEWAVDFDGQTMIGTMEISGEPGAFSGTISSDMGVADILSIEIDGAIATLMADTPQGELMFELEMIDDEFNGFGSMQGMEFGISGTRIPS